jgi:hypothetical protein
LNDKMAGLGSNISSSVKTNQKCLCSLWRFSYENRCRNQKIKDIVDNDVKEFNAFVMTQQIPAIILDKEK